MNWITALGAAVASFVPELITLVPPSQGDTRAPGAVVSRAEEGRDQVVFHQESDLVVVSDRAVLRGSGGAVASIVEHPRVSISLKSGQVAVHVGSRAVDLVLEDSRFRAKAVQLRAALAEGVWLVTITELFEGAELSFMAPKPQTALSTPDLEQRQQPALRVGSSYWVEDERLVLEEDPSIVEIVWDQVSFGSFAPSRDHGVSTADIESSRFLAAPSSAASGEMPEIELEPVEVEAGCVEICVE